MKRERINIEDYGVWNIKDNLLIARNKESHKWFYILFCVDFKGIGEDGIELPPDFIVGIIPFKYGNGDQLSNFHLFLDDYTFYKPTRKQQENFAKVVIREECKRFNNGSSSFGGKSLKYWLGLYDKFTEYERNPSCVEKKQGEDNDSCDHPVNFVDDTNKGENEKKKRPMSYKLRIERICRRSGEFTYCLRDNSGIVKIEHCKVHPTTENRLMMSAIVVGMRNLGLYDKVEIECTNGYIVGALDHNDKAKFYEKNSDWIQEFYNIISTFSISYSFKYKKIPKVYLAGKITHNWWRNEIYGGNGEPDRTSGINVGHYWNTVDEYMDSEYDAGFCIITGPHSIGCDHGCFHDEHQAMHTATPTESAGCPADSEIKKDDVRNACCHQIEKSDIVFAFIDSLDCHGTLAEIGYAYGKGKFICMLFKNKTIEKELWFVSQMGNVVFTGRKVKNSLTDGINEYWKHRG